MIGGEMRHLVLDCDGVDVITHKLIGDVITIGRGPSNDVVIDDPTVSAARFADEIAEWVSPQRLGLNKWNTTQWHFYY
jgi:hypothetical protein